MKKLLILLVLLFSSCASFHLSTLNHDPIYDTVLVVSPDTQVDTLNQFQFRNKLRTDFQFRYDFAQYALTQPRSFDWNNRILGNRYNVYNPYYGFGYNNYWNRDQMWNDWVWGYNSYSMWSPFGYDRWGYNYYGWNNSWWNGYNNWYNGPWHNQGYNAVWNRSRGNNVVYHSGRRGSSNIQNRVVANNTNRTRVVTNKPVITNKPIIINKPLVINNNKPRPRINNSRPRINNSIPRINNSIPNYNSTPTIRVTPTNTTRSSSNTISRGNSRRKN